MKIIKAINLEKLITYGKNLKPFTVKPLFWNASFKSSSFTLGLKQKNQSKLGKKIIRKYIYIWMRKLIIICSPLGLAKASLHYKIIVFGRISNSKGTILFLQENKPEIRHQIKWTASGNWGKKKKKKTWTTK